MDPPTPTPPTQPSPAHGPPSASDQQPLHLASPLPTSYTIYVDGGWDSTETDLYSTFQEQRDPTNRRGSAGIAIVPTGTDWQQQGTTIITLTNGVQVGSQPAHMELAAIIVGLALHRWYLPPQQGDTIYSECKSITDVINSAAPPLSKFPAKLPFLQAIIHHLQALKSQGDTWTEPKRTQSNVPLLTSIRTGTGAFYSPTAQPPITSYRTKIRIQQHL